VVDEVRGDEVVEERWPSLILCCFVDLLVITTHKGLVLFFRHRASPLFSGNPDPLVSDETMPA